MNLDELEARWRAGHILTSQLSEIARELLAEGHDVPAVRSLAEAGESDAGEARRTFERALRELGRGGMNASEAAMLLARGWAEQLLARRLSPRWATRAIAYVRFRGSADVDEALGPFTELEDEYHAVSQQAFARLRMLPLNRRARAEARRLVERG
ncbi:MAG: hypothetical protein ICV64_02200 [Thermoleophilia bacterium]|nr:hypothetical protein [Thermoleophilia bacterium]